MSVMRSRRRRGNSISPLICHFPNIIMMNKLLAMIVIEHFGNWVASGAIYDSAERHSPPKCHPHTREVVLKKIMEWIEDPHNRGYSCYHNDRPLQLFCIYGMFGSICESEGCRKLPSSKLVPVACPITFPSADALRNPISVEKLHGPIVMITAVHYVDYR